MKDFIHFTRFKDKGIQVGLYLSTEGFELAVLNKGPDGMAVSQVAKLQTEANAWDDALKQQVKLLNLQNAPCRVLLPASDYQMLLIEKPNVVPNELGLAIKWAIADQVDFPLEEAIIDYMELPQRSQSEQPNMLYVIVAKAQTIESLAKRINAAGLHVLSIDICQSALKHLALALEDPEEGQGLLHIEQASSYLILFKQKTILMMRHIEIGLDQLNEDVEQQSYRDLAMEIQRTIDYSASNMRDGMITRLVTTPLNKKNKTLLSYLSNSLGLPVREMQFGEVLALSSVNKEGQCLSAFAIGAAMGPLS